MQMTKVRPIGTRFYNYSASYNRDYEGERCNEQFTRYTLEVVNYQTCPRSHKPIAEIVEMVEREVSRNEWSKSTCPQPNLAYCPMCECEHINNTQCQRND